MNIVHRLFPFVVAAMVTACDGTADSDSVVGELASDRIELTAEAAEPIVDIAVDEGAAVNAGELLVQLDAQRATARLAEAEASLAQAEARLAELVRGPRGEQIAAARANVDGAEKELEFRNSDYARQRELHAKGLTSPDNLDRANVAYETAIANLELRRAQLEERLAGTTIEELAQAESAVRQAEARCDAAKVDVDRHSIRAPADGIVDSRLLERGERPMPGDVVMVMLAGTQPHARVYVPEEQRVHVTPGTPAHIFVDGLDQPIDGRVRWVASEAAFTPYFALTERDRGRLTFAAKIDIVENRDRLPDGVPVKVQFLAGESVR